MTGSSKKQWSLRARFERDSRPGGVTCPRRVRAPLPRVNVRVRARARERERETERGKYTQFDRDKSDTNRFIITHTRCPQNNHARKAHTHPRPTLLLAPRFARLDQSSFFPCFSVRCVALQALHIAGHPTTPTPPFFSVSNSTITIVVVVRQRRRLRRPPRPSSLIKLVVSPLGQASPASQSAPVLCL